MASYMAYSEALNKAGAYVGSGRLQPTATATTVRVVDGKSQVLDGPYVDSKEQLGGYFIIDVPDLDAAISWAARCPAASHGTVELRANPGICHGRRSLCQCKIGSCPSRPRERRAHNETRTDRQTQGAHDAHPLSGWRDGSSGKLITPMKVLYPRVPKMLKVSYEIQSLR